VSRHVLFVDERSSGIREAGPRNRKLVTSDSRFVSDSALLAEHKFRTFPEEKGKVSKMDGPLCKKRPTLLEARKET
jgi:hypothetical protein